MPATTKKLLIVIGAPAASAVSASAENYNGTARARTGLSGNFNTRTTAATVAASFDAAGLLGTAANIEAVNFTTTGGTTGVLAVRTVAVPLATTLTGVTMTVGGTVYTASVTTLNAFADAGLTQDAELAAMSSIMQAVAAAASA